MTVEALAQAEPASFDVVTCLEMLVIVPNPCVGDRSLRQTG